MPSVTAPAPDLQGERLRMRFDDEAETLSRSRAIADEIMRELSVRLPPPPPPASEACELVVLPPRPLPVTPHFEIPWTPPPPPVPAAEAKRPKRRDGTGLPWAVFAMAAGIALALWADGPSRARARSELAAVAAGGHRIAASVAVRFGR